MDAEKQKLLIEYLISSPDTFALCQNVVKADYFNPEFRNAVRFIKEYYEKFNTTPAPEQIKAESKQLFVKRTVEYDQIEYCSKEVEAFCKRKAMEDAVIKGAKMVNDGDYGSVETLIRDAILISLNQNLGTKYFDNPLKRLNAMLQDDPTETTGWKTVDEKLFGGFTRGELILFSANSGGGKSITLANLALNFSKRGRNVLYISLELSEQIISQRFDTMITGFGRKDWKGHVSEIASKVEAAARTAGSIDIKHMPSGTTSSQLRAYLKEYYLKFKHMPDMLIVDYLDNMAPNEFVSADNIWARDKFCSEQLRQVGVDFNMFVVTASQLNREAVKATQHDHSHIAGGISKINVSDVYISIKMTESMRAQGQMLFSFQKTRNSDGVGTNLFMKWDNKRLLISDLQKEGEDLKLVNKKEKESGLSTSTPTGDGLMDFFDQ